MMAFGQFATDGGSMQNGQVVGLADEFGVQVEVIVQTPVRFRFVNDARHEPVGSVVVAFGFNQRRVELRQFRIQRFQCLGQPLELLATAPFNQ